MTALAETMAAQGVDERELARRTRLQPRVVAAVINGATPPQPLAARVARALDVTPARLWPDLQTRSRLAVALQRARIPADQLARDADVDPGRLGDVLAGRQTVDVAEGIRIARTLRLPIAELFDHVQVGTLTIPAADVRDPRLLQIPEHRTPEVEAALLTTGQVLDAPATGDKDWDRAAACRGHDPDRWWPTTDDDLYPRTVCAGCGVVGDCRDYYLNTKLPAGQRDHAAQAIWAGVRGSQLRAAARARQRDVASASRTTAQVPRPGASPPRPSASRPAAGTAAERLLAQHRADPTALQPVQHARRVERARALRLT